MADRWWPTRRAVLGAAVGTSLSAVLGAGLLRSHDQLERTVSALSRSRVDPGSISSVHARGRVAALTFDDGPDPASTPAVLDALDEFGVVATFFMIGRNVDEHPDVAVDVLRRGHQVGNHTQDHLWLDVQPESVVRRQIRGGSESLARVGAPSNRLFRPPHGWTSRTVARVAHAQGLRSIFWSECLEHYLPMSSPSTAASAVAARAGPGSILLCHDGGHLDGPHPQSFDRAATVAALPLLIEAVLSKDLRFVTISELTGL